MEAEIQGSGDLDGSCSWRPSRVNKSGQIRSCFTSTCIRAKVHDIDQVKYSVDCISPDPKHCSLLYSKSDRHFHNMATQTQSYDQFHQSSILSEKTATSQITPLSPRISTRHSTRNSNSTANTFNSSTRMSEATNVTVPPAYSKKFVVVGDGGCGKTCLLISYSQGYFPEVWLLSPWSMKLTCTEIRTDSLWKLHHNSRTQTIRKRGWTCIMGYSWTRRVRSIETTFISRDRSALRLFRNRLSQFARKCHGQGTPSLHLTSRLQLTSPVVSRSPAFLSINTFDSRRSEIRSSQQTSMHRTPPNTRIDSSYTRTRSSCCQTDGCKISWMFSKRAEWCFWCLWNCNQYCRGSWRCQLRHQSHNTGKENQERQKEDLSIAVVFSMRISCTRYMWRWIEPVDQNPGFWSWVDKIRTWIW